MKYSIQILGIPNGDMSPSVLLQFDSQSYLFNVPEGTQRFCFEHKIRMSKLRQIFLTRMNWDQIGGLPGNSIITLQGLTDQLGMMLTMHDMHEEPIPLKVRGPKGLLKFIHSNRHFIYQTVLDSVERLELDNLSAPFKDENVIVEPIVLGSDGKLTHTKRKADQMDTSTNATCTPTTTVAYLCRGPKIPRKFDAQAAIKLGVKPGSNFKILSGGQSITLENGTVVQPDQVLKPLVLRDVCSLIHQKFIFF